eukprot:SAG31_NODE_3671_length_4002_cov_3.065334_5_plen_55_part_00
MCGSTRVEMIENMEGCEHHNYERCYSYLERRCSAIKYIVRLRNYTSNPTSDDDP